MKELDMLREEKSKLSFDCSEINCELAALRVRKTQYENTLLLKNHQARIKTMCVKIAISSILIFALLAGIEWMIKPSFFVGDTPVHLLPTFLGINMGIHAVNTVRGYLHDKKCYYPTLSTKFYMDMSIEELKGKIKELEKKLEQDQEIYDRMKITLHYFDHRIEEIEKTEEYQTFIKEKEALEQIPVSGKWYPEEVDIHAHTIPKIKMKRRNEYDTKTKGNL